MICCTCTRLDKLLPGSPKDIRFCGSFGVSTELAKTTWEVMENPGLCPSGITFHHFLWALAFMQMYPANNNTLSRVLGGHDSKTISKNVWPVIRSIYALNDVVVSCDCCVIVFANFSVKSRWHFSLIWTQIRFEDRKKGVIGNDCLLSVDGTDFLVAMGWSKSFYSYKFKKSGLRYEAGLCIKTGDICWWSGPYVPGICITDPDMFNLKH